MNRARTTAALAFCALLAACSQPKYANYTSLDHDWQANVPWGWSVMTDREGANFAHTAFIGPFEPDFYLGAPSLQVRWYAYGIPHKLVDGELEIYPSADVYIKQTLDLVYGKAREMPTPVEDLDVGGRKGKHFVVVSARPAPKWANWGTSISKADGTVGIIRQHAYVVVPMTRGFYVLIYPATQAGFPLYEKRFNEFAHTFQPLTDGPGGPKVVAAMAAPVVAKKGR